MKHSWKSALYLAIHPRILPGVLLTNVMSQKDLRAALYRYIDIQDRFKYRQSIQDGVPPAALRYRVHGDLSVDSFLGSGKQCAQDIKDALAKVGKALQSFKRILDFGCGCARTMIGLRGIAPSLPLVGTDIDAEAISWCQRHLHFASFETNNPLPPLRHPSGTFDLIYAISVFTHLNEEFQFAWLRELERVTQRKGYVVLTVHGNYYWDGMLSQDRSELQKTGYLFKDGPSSMRDLFPDWYQTAFHTETYVRSNYSKYFKVLAYIPSGMDQCQDVVVLQKP